MSCECVAILSQKGEPEHEQVQSLRAEVVLAFVTRTRKDVRDALQEVVEEGEDVHDALVFLSPLALSTSLKSVERWAQKVIYQSKGESKLSTSPNTRSEPHRHQPVVIDQMS